MITELCNRNFFGEAHSKQDSARKAPSCINIGIFMIDEIIMTP